MKISTHLVRKLIGEQFPRYHHLPISQVNEQGHDNRSFRLGDQWLVRLPSAASYAKAVAKEQQWLPYLAPQLSLKIPKPLHMGNPSADYPYPWSIYEWIRGTPLNQFSTTMRAMHSVAKQLGDFLHELHGIPIMDAPIAWENNFFRGIHLTVYDEAMHHYLADLQGEIDTKKAWKIWTKALQSRWDASPIWLHGDLVSTNMLMEGDQLKAVIDFGTMAVGDPACDLMMYWYFFQGATRAIFKQAVDMDPATWERARGWALWKACFQLTQKEKTLAWRKKVDAVLNFA